MNLIVSAFLFAQTFWPIHVADGIKASVSISYTYDSNPFLLSDELIDEFLNGSNSQKFTDIQTVDDLTAGMSLRMEFDIHGKKLEVEHKLRHFLRNTAKDYQVLAVRFRFNRYISLSLKHVPEFFIRYYRDRDADGEPYKKFGYQSNGLTFRLKPEKFLSVSISITHYDYPISFNEYDATNWAASASLRLGTLTFGYRFTLSKAQGADESWLSDPSYAEHGLSLGFDSRHGRIGYHADITLKHRIFLSEKPTSIDPFHAGRKDMISNISLDLSYRMNKRLSFSTTGSYTIRAVDSDYKADIDEVKDYKRAKLAAGLRLTI